MPSKHKPLPVRASPALRALIDQAGPVNAATRALIILGAETAGLDLAGIEREAASLLAAKLTPGVAEGLRRLVARPAHEPVRAEVAPIPAPRGDPPPETAANDPLGGVGWEV